MKLYVTFTSPYARLARILVIEKTLEDRVEIIAAIALTIGLTHLGACRTSSMIQVLAWRTANSSALISTT